MFDDDDYTKLIDGKRVWDLDSPYVLEMLGRYTLGMEDCYDFFVDVFKDELGLREGDFTSYLDIYGSSHSGGLVLGGKVLVFPFVDSDWVVKNGEYERVVENMDEIFDLMREAWNHD